MMMLSRDLLFVPVLGLVLLCGVAGCDRGMEVGAGLPEEREVVQVVPMTNMVLVSAGAYLRGGHEVVLSRDFWVGRYEVTQGEYEQLAGSNPSHFVGDARLPVEKVSYMGAVEYCRLLSERERGAGRLPEGYLYRLPTEAEWEYACRAGSTNRFSFGDGEVGAGDYAWTSETSEGRTHPVGEKLPNAWGLYDMHGNVWELCHDWFEVFPTNAVTDPMGPGKGEYRVFRGGGWDHEAKFARCANRFMMGPSNGIYFVGFRVVLARGGVGQR
ncbi:MAG: Serine/threonine-protein kinase pkn1 [Verrucomicrobiota bacterium]|jgi:formylglycine-generating enzyme required for sulfatase activity